jgi:hypothetical protein
MVTDQIGQIIRWSRFHAIETMWHTNVFLVIWFDKKVSFESAFESFCAMVKHFIVRKAQ